MIDINLVPPHLRKKQSKQMLLPAIINIPQETIVALVGGLFVVLFLIHLILQTVILVKFVQHSREKKQLEAILPDKQKVDAVLTESRILQNKINSIEKITTEKRISWSQKLNDISDSVPKGVWLNKVSLSEKVLLIDGSAVSRMNEEMISVGSLIANLKSRKSFLSGLKNIEVGSIQRRQIHAVEIADFLITVKLQ